MDPPVSDSGTYNFPELGSAEQILALCIGYKPGHSEWQTGTSGFSITYKFSRLD
jgi:hypothetical protein